MVTQAMRVAPETIEMQIKFLITLLSSIEERAIEGTKYPSEVDSRHRRPYQQSRQSHMHKSSNRNEEYRKGRVPTEVTSLASGAKEQWTNHPSDMMPSPVNRLRSNNRSSDPRGYLPGN